MTVTRKNLNRKGKKDKSQRYTISTKRANEMWKYDKNSFYNPFYYKVLLNFQLMNN